VLNGQVLNELRFDDALRVYVAALRQAVLRVVRALLVHEAEADGVITCITCATALSQTAQHMP
jgi:hypothetical protein